MCDSFHLRCQCGKKSAELFFGRMVLNQQSVVSLHCPECNLGQAHGRFDTISDNGWVLTLNMAIVRNHASTFGLDGDALTADWVFDQGYVTWAGITPDDTTTRNREREELQSLAKTDLRAYLAAMKEWGIGREKRFSAQGWRKAR